MKPIVTCAQRKVRVRTCGDVRVLPPLPVAFVPEVSVQAPHGFDALPIDRLEAEMSDLPGLMGGAGGTLLIPHAARSWLELGRDGLGRDLRTALANYGENAAHVWLVGDRELSLERPLVMGIVNVTPDSFSDGGKFRATNAAIEHGVALVGAGADMLDVGGESTRPGSDPVDVEEELARVVPVVRGLAERVDVPISIDTRKADVAAAALEVGATIINDVSALRDDSRMPRLVAEAKAGCVLMHMRGQPKTMQEDTSYSNLIGEIVDHLEQSLTLAYDEGIDVRRVLVDPGIGFGKRLEQNLALVARTQALWALGRPQLLGPSRKRFLGELTGRPVQERSAATVAAVAACVLAGAAVVRVHEAGAARDAVRVAKAMRPYFAERE